MYYVYHQHSVPVHTVVVPIARVSWSTCLLTATIESLKRRLCLTAEAVLQLEWRRDIYTING